MGTVHKPNMKLIFAASCLAFAAALPAQQPLEDEINQPDIFEQVSEIQTNAKANGVNLNLRPSRVGFTLNPKQQVKKLENLFFASLSALKHENIDIINSANEVLDTKLQSIMDDIWSKANSQILEGVKDPAILDSVLKITTVVKRETQKQLKTRQIIETNQETIKDKLDAAVNKVATDFTNAVKHSPEFKQAQQTIDQVQNKIQKLN